MHCIYFSSKRLGTSPVDYISSFLKTHISHKEAERVNQLKVQMVWLEAPPQKGKITNLDKRPRKRLTSRWKKELKLYQIPREHQKLVPGLVLVEPLLSRLLTRQKNWHLD